MNKKIKIALAILLILIIAIFAIILCNRHTKEISTIKSEKQLLRIYEGTEKTEGGFLINVLTAPFSFFNRPYRYYETQSKINYDFDIIESTVAADTATIGSNESAATGTTKETRSKDYSTTNIQVENVDEADIIKTDGDYIYSISENNVIITNVENPENIKIEATIGGINSQTVPEELIINNNKLIIIYTKVNNKYYYSYMNKNNTIVNVYDITNKSTPLLVKSYELYEPYYTSRCIGNELYVISSGELRVENNKVLRTYKEDNISKEIELNKIHYLKEVDTTKQTIISSIDLSSIKSNINISSYLIDISNAYVSENSIYLLDQKYDGYYNNNPHILQLFGLKGVFGAFNYDDDDYGYKTEIYKFNISESGKVKYSAKNKIKGQTINQYSLDEKNGHLRIALYDNDGARIAIFDNNLKQIGISESVAEGEQMYSSRFMGDKAYLVTYRTVDPLFVIDLSDETHPQILGELHIPGYSTYLHPYDENHLIGIGMETEEVVNRDYNGRIRSTTARIVGMKMALFDVTNVNNPIQLSQTIIGDRRTTSAILTNPKALLFSKEKQLIAIPVNNYDEDFAVSDSNDSIDSLISSYSSYSKSRVGEGYFVYNINLDDGFTLKGVVTHTTPKESYDYDYYYYYDSKLLRGLYIDNNLYTVSESAVKVNNLDTLELVSELNIK